MDGRIKSELDRLIPKIIANRDVEKIILFGSHARGNPTPHSDLDICVLTREKKRKIEILQDISVECAFETEFPLDILVYSPEEFMHRADSRTSIESSILRNGVVVYG